MTVQECYDKMESNYGEALGHLGNDRLIEKYLRKFLVDESYHGLCAALAEKEYGKAFEHVHNLKGVGLNLAFTRLHKSAGELCEALRGGEPKGDIDALLENVKEDYEKTISAIQQL